MSKKLTSHEDLPYTPVTYESTRTIKTGDWRTMKPFIDKGLCKKCGICWKFCPDMSIVVVEDYPEINYDYCKGCGICAYECPFDAIKMLEEEEI